MPRKPRFQVPGLPAHVVQRGNNRQAIFFASGDYAAYLNWLREGIERYGCELHAYVLMTNHVHLLVTPNTQEGIGQLMQYVGRHFVPYVNHSYGRTGTLWEGRYKASVVQEGRYLLTCMRYIEMNPVRAGMVKSPATIGGRAIVPMPKDMKTGYSLHMNAIAPWGARWQIVRKPTGNCSGMYWSLTRSRNFERRG